MINEDELLKKASKLGKKNYEFNKSLKSPEGYINGQKKCAVSGHKLGLRKAAGNGCGAIAVYNAMLCAGYSPNFPLIVLGLDTYALRMGGILGTDPEKMEKFFSVCKIPAIKASDYDDFINVMKAVKVGILCYWVAKPHRSLLHFVAIMNGGDGNYYVCNRYSNRKKPSPVKSIEQLCTKDRYVNGFFVS